MAVGMGNDVLGLRMDVSIPPKTERELRRTLDKIEPGVRRQLSNKLRTGLRPMAAYVSWAVPAQAPLSGMQQNWGLASSKIRTYPKSPPGKAIATISVFADSSRFAKYLSLTELAGYINPRGVTRTGNAMIRNLQARYPLVGRGGRFIWKAWLRVRPAAIAVSIDAINEFVTKFNGKA